MRRLRRSKRNRNRLRDRGHLSRTAKLRRNSRAADLQTQRRQFNRAVHKLVNNAAVPAIGRSPRRRN